MSTYVLRGMGYFFTHPRLWMTALCPILLTMVVALAVTISLFAAALEPQEDALADAGVPDVLAWILAVLLVIVEIFVVTLIFNLIVLGCYQDKIFEQVLKYKGHQALVENEELHASCAQTCNACCRVNILCQLLLLIITLPLNLLPVIGTLIFVWVNGTLLAWGYHLYYFEMKGWSYDQQKQFIRRRKLQYTSFGAQAMFIEMIPFFASLFIFTNTVGAALFAADIEDELNRHQPPSYQSQEPAQGYSVSHV